MPLLWTTIAFIAGIIAGNWFDIPVPLWAVAAGTCLAALILIQRRRFLAWQRFSTVNPAALLLLFSLGGARIALANPVIDPSSLAFYNDKGQARLTGWVVDPPELRETAVYARLRVTEMERQSVSTGELASQPTTGDVLVRFTSGSALKMGDVLQFYAEPATPDDGPDFSYRKYLSRQGIQSVAYYPTQEKLIGSHTVDPLRSWLENVRQQARKTIFRLFPQPESGLLEGILLGLDNDLPASLQQAYRNTGTAHIIAISGFNMAILAGILMQLASKAFKRTLAVVLTAMGLVLYSILVGGSASVVRAAIMAVVAMGGHLIGRNSTGPTALFFTAAVMCLFNPFLIEDTSFQLSFAATFGLVMLGSPLKNLAEKAIGRFVAEDQVAHFSGPVSEYFLFTLAAQLATLPVIALQFKRFSVSSLLSNPLVLPVQPAVLITGGISTALGMVFEPAGRLGAFVAWPLLAYTNKMVAWISQAGGSSVVIDQRLALAIVIISLLAWLIFLLRNKLTKLPGGLPFTSIALVLMTAAIAIWVSVLHQPDGRLHLRLIRSDIEVTLAVTAPKGTSIILNPGKGVNELTSSISQTFNPWQNHVDAAVITQRSASRNLAAFNERLPIQTVLLAPSARMTLEDTPPVSVDPALNSLALENGESLTLEENVQLTVVAADTRGTALLLSAQGDRILIPGGIDPARLHALNPATLAELTAVVLTPADLTFVPPHWWDHFHASQIFWQDVSEPPEDAWLSLGDNSVLEFVSDGSAYALLTR